MKFLFPFIFLLPCFLKAQVVINEFSAANFSNYQIDNGTPDWVELMNTGTLEVNLNGWFLSDDLDDLEHWVFPSDVILAPGERLVVLLDNKDTLLDGLLHTNFKITQTKPEGIALTAPNGTLSDSYEITIPNCYNHSFARFPDGSGVMRISTLPSPGTENAGDNFSAYTPTPTASVESGISTGPVSVSLSVTGGGDIRYTLDGNAPTASSTLYTSAILISDVKVLRARVFAAAADDKTEGHTLTNTYLVGVAHTLPIVSLSGGDGVNTLLDGGFSNQIAAIEIFTPQGQLACETEGDMNKHGNDSWAYSQRGFDWVSRDEMGINNELDYQIFPSRDRDEFQRLILKPAANDNYPTAGGAHIRDAYVHTLAQNAGMVLDARTNQPCVLYKNGEYWGLYELREKVDDHDYTSQYYGQGEKWIDFIKTWGGTWEEYGSWADWYTLKDFILNNDMSVASNYTQAESQLEMLSLIDYFLINTHTVCTDWLNWNTAWWRGRNPNGEAQKWRYALWDLDATFGHYINYTGVPSIDPDAAPCQANNLGSDFEGHGALIEALLENETFHSLYVNRYADMLNTYLNCEYMQGLLDTMIAEIEPEMPGQIAKWGGSMSEWQSNVQTLKDFIDARCTVINEGIEDCYEVEGPYPFVVAVDPPNVGHNVGVNTLQPAAYPWSGNYFSPVGMSLLAQPADGWLFDYWESSTGDFLPSTTSLSSTYNFEGAGATVTAHFIPESPCGLISDYQLDSSNNTIALSWLAQSAATSYELGYRLYNVGADWSTLNLPTANIVIGNLEACSYYEIRLRSVCTLPATGDYLNLLAHTKCASQPNASADFAPLAFSAWPNPTEGLLQVQLLQPQKNCTLYLYQPTGKLVLEQMAHVSGLTQLQLDHLSEGLYLLRVVDAYGNSATEQVLIRH